MAAKILIVDDSKFNIKVLTDILVDEGYEIVSLENSTEVLETVHAIKPDIIILDVIMPGIDGFQVCKSLKGDFEIKDIPIIMLTAKSKGSDIKKALELGAFDYMKKPIDEVEVIARVQSALRYKHKLDELKEMAMKDGLTGLYNHALLIELFEKEYIKQRRDASCLAFAMLDIDYFKKVNDTYGHMVGDVILKQLAGILTESVRRSDIVGRYGGEEFSIVIPEATSDDVFQLCERIRKSVENYSFYADDKVIKITVSIGIYFKGFNDEISHIDMIKKADEKLYKAKRDGRNRVEIN